MAPAEDNLAMAHIEIALATFQSAKYLRAQLTSLFAQSHQDFSILVADDGSTDSTLDILAEYSALNPNRIRLLTFEGRSGGPCENFARILHATQAPYLMFCDHDDVWLPDKIAVSLSRMRNLEEKSGSDKPLLVHTDLAVVNSELQPLFSSFAQREHLSPRNSELRRLIMQNNVTGCTMLMNRALYRLARPIPQGAPMHDWWIALVAAAFGRISFVDSATVLYRQHASNIVGITKRRSLADQFTKIIDFVRGRNGRGTARLHRVTKQAQLFEHQYASLLSPSQYIMVSKIANLWNMPIAVRIWTLIANRFFAFRNIRTIQFLIAACSRVPRLS